MRALKVGIVKLITVASPDYLHQFGTPDTPENLSIQSVIASSAADHFIDWQFKTAQKSRTIRIDPRLMVSTNDAAIEATRLGFGITRVLSYQVAPYLESGELERILQEFEPEEIPIHIVHREERHSSSKIRAFIDLLAGRLRSDIYLQEYSAAPENF